MSSVFGSGFDAPRTPIMSQQDKDSVEESKVPDPSMVDAGDSGGNNPHGDVSCGDVMQVVTQIQRGDNDIQDWDAEVLNHMLVHVLEKDQVEASATDDFTMFVIANGIEDVCLLFTMLEDDFKLMGYDIDFKTFRLLQIVNEMHNEQISDAMSKDDKNVWFPALEKHTLMRCKMGNAKVTTMPSANIVSTHNVLLGQSNSNEAKLEMARSESGDVQCWETAAGSCADS